MSQLSFSFLPILAAVLLSTSPAASQSMRQMTDDIDRMQKEIKALQRQVFPGEDTYFNNGRSPAPGSAQAANPALVLVRLDQIEESLRALTGRVEEMAFKQRRFEAQFEAFRSQALYRLDALDGANTAPASQESETRPPTSTGSDQADADAQGAFARAFKSPPGVSDSNQTRVAAAGLPAPAADVQSPGAAADPRQLDDKTAQQTPREAFDRAFQFARRDRFDDAEQAFLMFLADYPEDPLSSNAQYWLGRVYMAKQQRPQAAEAFLEGYRKYPDGNKAPENLLAFASTLRAMEKPSEACTALQLLRTKIAEDAFPNVSNRVLQGIDSESSLLACS